MDWGLAKVLPRGGVVDDEKAGKADRQETVIATARSGSDDPGLSRAGSVMGTPAYMAPEQARGEVDRVDERADVFALGSILCEILTGEPAFLGPLLGRDPAQGGAGRPGRRPGPAGRLRGRRRADRPGQGLPGPRARGPPARTPAPWPSGSRPTWPACRSGSAPPSWPAPPSRPAPRRPVAPRRGRAAGAPAVPGRAGGLAAGADHRRRADLHLPAPAAARQRAARSPGCSPRRRRCATRPGREAGDPGRVARGAGGAGAGRGPGAGGPGRRPCAARSEAGLDEAERDARLRQDAGRGPGQSAGRRRRGRPTRPTPPPSATRAGPRRPRSRPSRPSAEAPARGGGRSSWRPSSTTGRPCAARRGVRSPPGGSRWRRRGWPTRTRIATGSARSSWPRTASREAEALEGPGRRARGGRAAGARRPSCSAGPWRTSARPRRPWPCSARAAGRHPGDVWVNYALAEALDRLRPSAREEAVRYYTAARALRPETAHELAHLLERMGRGAEAEAVFRDLVESTAGERAAPGLPGDSLEGARPGRRGGADPRPGRRRRSRGDPAPARRRHGPLQPRPRPGGQGKLDEAVAAYREAIRLQPDTPRPTPTSASPWRPRGSWTRPIAAFREAIRLQPDDAEAHINLGIALTTQGKLDEADRRIPRGDPAQARLRRGPRQPRHRPDGPGEAGRGHRRIPRGDPAPARRRRGPHQPRHRPARPGEAGRGRRRIPRGDPAQARPRRGPLQPRHRPDGPGEAGRGHRRIPRGDPAPARLRRGPQQPRQRPARPGEAGRGHRRIPRGDPAQARPRRGPHQPRHRPATPRGSWTRPSPNTARRSGSSPTTPRPTTTSARPGDQGKLRRGHRRIPRGHPAQARRRRGPLQPRHRPGDQGKLDEAIAAYREAIRLKPDYAEAHYNLGIALRGQGKLDEADRRIPRGDPAQARLRRGPLQPRHRPACPGEAGRGDRRIPRGDPAQARLRRGPLQPGTRSSGARATTPGRSRCTAGGTSWARRQPGWRYPSAQWVAEAERLAALAARLPALLKGEDRPKDVAERLALAQMCYDTKRHAAAARFWAEALAADPKLGDDRQAGHRYNAACAAALAGCRPGDGRPEAR